MDKLAHLVSQKEIVQGDVLRKMLGKTLRSSREKRLPKISNLWQIWPRSLYSSVPDKISESNLE